MSKRPAEDEKMSCGHFFKDNDWGDHCSNCCDEREAALRTAMERALKQLDEVTGDSHVELTQNMAAAGNGIRHLLRQALEKNP